MGIKNKKIVKHNRPYRPSTIRIHSLEGFNKLESFFFDTRLELTEELLDCLNLEERDVICCLFGLKGYQSIKRPSIRKVAKIFHHDRTYLSNLIKTAINKIRREYCSYLLINKVFTS